MPQRSLGDISLIELVGTPEEMGAEHGRLLKDEIHFFLEGFLRRSDELIHVPYSHLIRESRRCEPFIPHKYLAELKALSEASGASYEELLALNCLPDVDATYSPQFLHCCNFVVAPPFTAGHVFAHGRNLDFPFPADVHARAATLIVRRPSDTRAVPTFTVTWAGYVGCYTACNPQKVSVGEVSVPSANPSPEGIPVGFLLREILESGAHVAGAIEQIKAAPRTAGYNIMVADAAAGEAAGIETTRSIAEARPLDGGFLVVDDLCLCRKAASGRLSYPAGVLRHARATQLILEHKGRIDSDLMISFLKDRHDLAVGEIREPDYRGCNTICNYMTRQSVLFVLGEDYILVSHDSAPAPLGTFRRIDLRELWTQEGGHGTSAISGRAAQAVKGNPQ